jgi:DUF971 family protein
MNDMNDDQRPGPYDVDDVEIDREVAVRITYADGLVAVFPVMALRQGCPCAGCRGRRDEGLDAYGGTTISILGAELHGNWGLAIRWSDGHDTGIHAWSNLRRWWEAGLDADPVDPAGPGGQTPRTT